MAALNAGLRGQLEKAVLAAREQAEKAAEAALCILAVERGEAFSSHTLEQRRLRVGLRARARQLGGSQMDGLSQLLLEEVAYEQWHRMLFARFLAENDLLRHPGGALVTLQDCAELAREESGTDAWQLAARYASALLPGIFRADDPSAQVTLAPEGQAALEVILANIPTPVFTSDDGLGWVYQYWQTKRRKEVTRSRRKIGSEDLPAVTQFFTEDYMVRFLLENSLGAWWASRHPDSQLVKDFS
ncbi:MAG TPA: SAM-dependent DNA methyltransferase, partial [Chloroflexota bacterium]|nr:SAM-dependent DNA methyltransferase [Chloroflexota bacterium]